jgi:hypothetical protein
MYDLSTATLNNKLLNYSVTFLSLDTQFKQSTHFVS